MGSAGPMALAVVGHCALVGLDVAAPLRATRDQAPGWLSVRVRDDGVVAGAAQALVMERAARPPAHGQRLWHGDGAEGLAGPQGSDDPGRVRDQALGQVARFGTGVGDHLLALAVIQLLRHLQRLGRRPAEARPAQPLQAGQVVQPRRPLALVLHLHRERPGEALRQDGDCVGVLALEQARLRRMPHAELPGLDHSRRDHLEVGLRDEVPDLQLALAHNGQRRRLHPSHPDHRACTFGQGDRCGPGERQVVDLVGLPPGDGCGIQAGILPVRLCLRECVADGLRVALPRFAWIMPPSERAVGAGRSRRGHSSAASAA